MIPREIIDKLDPESKSHVQTALATLARSGILLAVVETELARLSFGSAEADDVALMQQVRDYRVRTGVLRELHDDCEGIRREIENDPL